MLVATWNSEEMHPDWELVTSDDDSVVVFGLSSAIRYTVVGMHTNLNFRIKVAGSDELFLSDLVELDVICGAETIEAYLEYQLSTLTPFALDGSRPFFQFVQPTISSLLKAHCNSRLLSKSLVKN